MVVVPGSSSGRIDGFTTTVVLLKYTASQEQYRVGMCVDEMVTVRTKWCSVGKNLKVKKREG